jgi:hypothetical protein
MIRDRRIIGGDSQDEIFVRILRWFDLEERHAIDELANFQFSRCGGAFEFVLPDNCGR